MRTTIITSVLLTMLVSCELKQKEFLPTDEFVKVYNHPDENQLHYGYSVLQIEDGFLMLIGVKRQEIFVQYPTATIIKTNELGEISWTLETDWEAPAPKLLDLDGKIGFIAMDGNKDAHFVAIDPSSGSISGTTALNLTMPLAAQSISGNKFVVLGYNFGSWSSIVSTYSNSLEELNKEELAVGEDFVSSIDEHLRKTNYEYPFFIGEWQNGEQEGFFVNCLYNYTLGVNFFTSEGASTGGWIVVQQVRFAPSSLLHKKGNEFALTRYYYDKNFLSPTIQVDVNDNQNFNDSTQNPLHELPPKAKIKSINVDFDGNTYMLFASNTNFNAISISQYQLNSDELYHTKYVDFSDKIEVIDIIQDKTDEGIVVLVRINITGRFLRPALIKIPKRLFKPIAK